MPIKMQDQKIPSSPGVYFFSAKGGSASDGKKEILYIGKAANLRTRLSSYKDAISPKVSALLKEADNLNWQILNSETEALIKESELIKKYQPKYNVLMRDDKQYFFVAITKEEYPRIFLTHQPTQSHTPYAIRHKHKAYGMRHTANFIGPFSDGGAIKSVLKLLRRIFPYCTCKRTHKNLCLNARIGRCLGFCCNSSPVPPPLTVRGGGEGVALYRKNINSIKSVITGKNKSLLKTLKKEMKKLSVKQKYEDAGKIRNQIRALEKIFAHKEIISRDLVFENIKAISSLESLLKLKNINRIEAYDIANIQGKYAYGSMAVFIDGAPTKDLYRIFKIKTVSGANDTAMLKEVISRRFAHKEWQYPEAILVDGGKGQLGGVIDALNNSSPSPRLRFGVAGQPPSSYSKRRGARGVALLPKLIALTKNKKHIGDHIYISGQKSPLPLDSLPSPLKNLLLYLDSEAHRFAIKHYRQSHRKTVNS